MSDIDLLEEKLKLTELNLNHLTFKEKLLALGKSWLKQGSDLNQTLLSPETNFDYIEALRIVEKVNLYKQCSIELLNLLVKEKES